MAAWLRVFCSKYRLFKEHSKLWIVINHHFLQIQTSRNWRLTFRFSSESCLYFRRALRHARPLSPYSYRSSEIRTSRNWRLTFRFSSESCLYFRRALRHARPLSPYSYRSSEIQMHRIRFLTYYRYSLFSFDSTYQYFCLKQINQSLQIFRISFWLRTLKKHFSFDWRSMCHYCD